MKKIIALLLVLVMALGLFAGCTSNQENNDDTITTTTTTSSTTAGGNDQPADPAQPGDKSALTILETVWANLADDYKFFGIGGDSTAYVENAPGAFNLTNTEGLSVNLVLPAELHGQIDEAASILHAMNANTFTGAVYHLTAGTDAAAFAQTLRDGIQGNQWMCGWPEKLYIAVIDGQYIVQFFGAGDLIAPFVEQLTGAYTVEELFYEEIL